MDALATNALNDAVGGNPWALLVVVVGVVVFVLDRVAHWVHKLRAEVRQQEKDSRDGGDLVVTMAEIHRNTQAMAIIMDKHLDRHEVMDRNVEKTMDGVQRVEEMVKGMA